MALRIRIEVNPQDWYTNTDSLSGYVVLDVQRTVNISSVAILLLGTVHTQLTHTHDMGQKFQERAVEDNTVVEERRQLFPPRNYTGGDAPKYTMAAGTHKFEFHFPFPDTDAAALPPSVSDLGTREGWYAAVKYCLKAVVNKAGLLGSSTTATQTAYYYVTFLPADHNLDALPTFAATHSLKSELLPGRTVSGLLSRLRSTLAHDKAKTCADVAFELRADSLLLPGQKMTLVLGCRLVRPEGGSITIDSVSFVLVSQTQIQARTLLHTYNQGTPILTKSNMGLSLQFPTEDPEYEYIDLGDTMPKLPETVPPTFNTRTLSRKYWLEVKIKFGHEPGSLAGHKTILRHKVHVRSGTYTDETGHIEKVRATYPQASSYSSRPPFPATPL